jgi:hypothetical protein
MKKSTLFLALVAAGVIAAAAHASDGKASIEASLAFGAIPFVGSVKTQGTELYFLDPDAGIVKVGCVTTISGLTAARDQIETTCLDSEARTYEAGMATPGTATFGINFDPNDASHVRLHELYRAGTKFDWALGWSDGTAPPTEDTGGNINTPSTRTWIVFNGYVADLPFDFTLNAVVASTVSVQVSDFPVLVPKA